MQLMKWSPHRTVPAAARLAVGTTAGVAVLVVLLALGAAWGVAILGGWDTVAAIFLPWVWLTVAPMDDAETASHSQLEDVSRGAADATLLGASVASLVAVGYTLIEAGHKHGTGKGLLIALAIVSVTLAWSTVHTIFALQYASLYYASPAGGIDFHDDESPDYRDLAYVAFTIGMTFQVSDTDLLSKAIRRTAMRQALLSYLFGAVIVAITINLVASLLSK